LGNCQADLEKRGSNTGFSLWEFEVRRPQAEACATGAFGNLKLIFVTVVGFLYARQDLMKSLKEKSV
jgi:hypothetical protein